MRRRNLLIGAGLSTAAGAGLWWQRRNLLFQRADDVEQSRALWPEDTVAERIEIHKSWRLLSLQASGRNVLNCRIALGFAPEGHKEREGDGRTPEGDYAIDYKNDQSRFHLSLHIDYPRPADRERAVALGVEPGGDIMIHGQPHWLKPAADEVLSGDWTLGCIAVSNGEMERIFAAVPLGCPVDIYA
jgi:murein L,D-transpeptidase YafK